jgi:hypothetical protein
VVGNVYALPPCPPDVFHNCFGTYTYGPSEWEGDKYVGEFKDGQFHGQGTYTLGPGESEGRLPMYNLVAGKSGG